MVLAQDCSKVLLTEEQRRSFLKELRRPGIDNLRRNQIYKRINEQCRKTKHCHHCGSINGVVKKGGSSLKILHEKYRSFYSSNAQSKQPPPSLVKFQQSFSEASKFNKEVDKHVKKAVDDLNPLRVLKLFRRINPVDSELLGFKSGEGRPEMLIWQYIPAPPICIRPSVSQDNASTEDDITAKLGDIVEANLFIKEGLRKGLQVNLIMELWDYLQLQIAVYISSDAPGLQKDPTVKPIRGFTQRLKGKQGRFRGNLSGKRVDFSGRTVISPDPNLKIDEVAVPELVAKNLTYPEVVTIHNQMKLKERVRNGLNKWPGANYIIKKEKMPDGTSNKFWLKYGNPNDNAHKLRIGDIVERHLEDGDIVLFNRQPSLHKLSILSHRAKIRPHRTFRLNECVCNPYNADFDGDEMNLHVPQTEEARTEAMELMGVKHNLATPKNGEPIIGAIQDFITGAYLMSQKDNLFNRKEFTQVCIHMLEDDVPFELPPPAILKPQMLWSGKQVFNVLMRPNKESQVLVNLDAPCKAYDKSTKKKEDGLDDNWLIIRNSEVMTGLMDKSTVGSGKKESVFYAMLRDFGPDAAIAGMSRLAKMSARWLTNQGFSIGISDVTPTQALTAEKAKLVNIAYAKCDEVILKFKEGTLEKQAGCDEETTMENVISGLLTGVRGDAGKFCIQSLSGRSAPLVMATSGSKGSAINVSQMVAVVGQQIIGGKRVQDGFQDRTLPHFPKNSRQPPSKGFVRNSFFTGLVPSEFIFHAISGREGLVDTAVKTAETGYMSRRLMKSLEDLATKYDDTVRNSSNNIVQFQYGDDKLDPVDMEAEAKPVHFDRTFIHSESTTWSNDEASLLPFEVMEICEELLSRERDKLVRIDLYGKALAYLDESVQGCDQYESARAYLQSVHDYVEDKAKAMASFRQFHGLPDCLDKSGCQRNTDTVATDQDGAKQVAVTQTRKLTRRTLETFIKSCLLKYERSKVEPGHAVGAVGAQSIGEPGTQMTLKTFHFAGVAGMSITQGVPRIKEIINASKEISTPVITCRLDNENEVRAARVVKGRIEKTYLGDIVEYVEDIWGPTGGYLNMRVEFETLRRLQLEFTMNDIVAAIRRTKAFKAKGVDIIATRTHIRVTVEQAAGQVEMVYGGNPLAEAKSRRETKTVRRQTKIVNPAKVASGRTMKARSASGKVPKKATSLKEISAKIGPLKTKAKEKKANSKLKLRTKPDGSKVKVRVRVQGMDVETKSKAKNTVPSKPKVPVSKSKSAKSGLRSRVISKRPNALRATGPPKALKPSSTSSSVPNPAPATSDNDGFLRLLALKRLLPSIAISGHPHATRAIIKEDSAPILDEKGNPIKEGDDVRKRKWFTLLVEGYGLQACMNTIGVRGTLARTNNVLETYQVLGIEAARVIIIAEIDAVMGEMGIDPRHMALLADVMTYKGEILGITRFGLSKMRDSTLQLASFEKTADHLFDAASGCKTDGIEGVSECIIMGQSVGLGTGGMEVVRRMAFEKLEVQGKDVGEVDGGDMSDGEVDGAVTEKVDSSRIGVGRRQCAFEEAWRSTFEGRAGLRGVEAA